MLSLHLTGNWLCLFSSQNSLALVNLPIPSAWLLASHCIIRPIWSQIFTLYKSTMSPHILNIHNFKTWLEWWDWTVVSNFYFSDLTRTEIQATMSFFVLINLLKIQFILLSDVFKNNALISRLKWLFQTIAISWLTTI